MQQAIEQCRGQGLIICQSGSSLSEGQIAGEDHAGALVARGNTRPGSLTALETDRGAPDRIGH